MRSVINKYTAFQIGICTFKWNDSTNKYNYRPFNFYVWPKSKIFDKSMSMQSGTVSFLIDHNFDFNKLFKDGINYGRYGETEKINRLCR
jgi:poly(A)-specific ribonuclease